MPKILSKKEVNKLKEDNMFPIMIEFLTSEGYQIIEVNPGRKRGADIVAEKSGKRLIIEMKGDTKALDVDLGTAIWQLLRYMKGELQDYALAVTSSYKRYIKAVEYPLKKLNVKVFIVSEKGVSLFL